MLLDRFNLVKDTPISRTRGQASATILRMVINVDIMTLILATPRKATPTPTDVRRRRIYVALVIIVRVIIVEMMIETGRAEAGPSPEGRQPPRAPVAAAPSPTVQTDAVDLNIAVTTLHLAPSPGPPLDPLRGRDTGMRKVGEKSEIDLPLGSVIRNVVNERTRTRRKTRKSAGAFSLGKRCVWSFLQLPLSLPNVLRPVQIKLKVKKDKGDHERDANRKDLLQFLNSAFE